MYIFLSFDNVNEEDVTGFIVLSLRLKILSILLNRRQTYKLQPIYSNLIPQQPTTVMRTISRDTARTMRASTMYASEYNANTFTFRIKTRLYVDNILLSTIIRRNVAIRCRLNDRSQDVSL